MLVISRHDGASYVGAPGAVAGREGRHLETLPDVHCELAASGDVGSRCRPGEDRDNLIYDCFFIMWTGIDQRACAGVI